MIRIWQRPKPSILYPLLVTCSNFYLIEMINKYYTAYWGVILKFFPKKTIDFWIYRNRSTFPFNKMLSSARNNWVANHFPISRKLKRYFNMICNLVINNSWIQSCTRYRWWWKVILELHRKVPSLVSVATLYSLIRSVHSHLKRREWFSFSTSGVIR